VELEALDEAAFVRILEEPHNALVKQYQALLATEGVRLELKPDAVREIARIAAQVNQSTENIGARRLHTVLERLLDETLFEAPDLGASTVVFDAARVRERLGDIARDRELSRFIL
jgi:ATP-dependent HslUV protease ATP-binding subunit HslU